MARTRPLVGNGLHVCGGETAAHQILAAAHAGGVGAEGLGAPLAAEQDGPLVKYGQTAYLDGAGGPDERISGDPVKIPHIHGIEPAVEPYGLHIDVGVQQLGCPGLDRQGPVKDLLRPAGGIDPQILNAVFVGRYSALYIIKNPGIMRLCGDQKGFRSSWMSKSLGFVFLALEYHT